MNKLAHGPHDVLRGAFELLDMRERLVCEVVCRRWLEVGQDSHFWSSVSLPASALHLLKGRGKHVRKLEVTFKGATTKAEQLPEKLQSCTELEELSVLGMRQQPLYGLCDSSTGPVVGGAAIPSLSGLTLDAEPYFILSRYSHNTGSHSASIPLKWLSTTFPRLRRLWCHYLEVDPAVQGQGSQSETPMVLDQLQELSFVAVVHPCEEQASWNSAACRCDLETVAALAPKLEVLDIRCPRFHFGRMSRMAGQSSEDMVRMCQRFCAHDLSLLDGICSKFPKLKCLEVESLRQESSAPRLDGSSLRQLLGDESSPPKDFHLRVGGSQALLQALRAVPKSPGLTLETIDSPSKEVLESVSLRVPNFSAVLELLRNAVSADPPEEVTESADSLSSSPTR